MTRSSKLLVDAKQPQKTLRRCPSKSKFTMSMTIYTSGLNSKHLALLFLERYILNEVMIVVIIILYISINYVV